MNDQHFMQLALAQAHTAAVAGEVPVGAVLVRNGEVLAQAHNAPVSLHDPSAHAEVLVMREAARLLGNYRLDDCTLYVTLEPCTMCAGAMLNARLRKVVWGAAEPKTGAAGSVLNVFGQAQLNHQTVNLGGVMSDECAKPLQTFFNKPRAEQKSRAMATRLRDDAV